MSLSRSLNSQPIKPRQFTEKYPLHEKYPLFFRYFYCLPHTARILQRDTISFSFFFLRFFFSYIFILYSSCIFVNKPSECNERLTWCLYWFLFPPPLALEDTISLIQPHYCLQIIPTKPRDVSVFIFFLFFFPLFLLPYTHTFFSHEQKCFTRVFYALVILYILEYLI